MTEDPRIPLDPETGRSPGEAAFRSSDPIPVDDDDATPATVVENQHSFDDEEYRIDSGENYHGVDDGT